MRKSNTNIVFAREKLLFKNKQKYLKFDSNISNN